MHWTRSDRWFDAALSRTALAKRLKGSHDYVSCINGQKDGMSGEANSNRIEVVEGDITKQAVEIFIAYFIF